MWSRHENSLINFNFYISQLNTIFFFVSRLTRDKLEPLGIDVDVDKNKLVQSKKPSDRKAVKKAYQDAIMHRCRVTGENVALSGESSGTEDSAKESKH